MANQTTNKKKKNKSENGSNSLYIVEERIYGRGFSSEESIEFALMEFLAFLFGLEKIDGYSSRLEGVGHMMSLSDKPQILSSIGQAHLLRRILYDNAILNSQFIRNHSTCDIWEIWRDYYLDIHPDTYNENYKEKFSKYVETLKHSFTDEETEDPIDAFKRFFTVVDILRANTYDYTSDKSWFAKILFPFSTESLFYEGDPTEITKKKNSKDLSQLGEKLNVGSLFFRGQGHSILSMLALSSSDEKKQEIEKKLSNLLEKEYVFAKAVRLISGDCLEEHEWTVLNEDKNIKSLRYFPIESKKDCQEIFDNLADDFLTILNLNVSFNKKIRLLTLISSLYIYIYLLRRSYSVIYRYDNKFTEPYIPLVFGNCELKSISREKYSYSSKIITLAVRNWLLYSINEKVKHGQYASLKIYIDEPTSKFSDSNDAVIQFKQLISSIIYPNGKNERDIENITENCHTFQDLLSSCTRNLEQRRKVSKMVSDNMCNKIAKSIGLVTGPNNYLHYAITDELLEAVVISSCKDRYMQHSTFLDMLFKKFRMVVSVDLFKEIKVAEQSASSVDVDKIKKNEQLLQNRLKDLGLCKELSDARFYYIFNPYISD